jgi:translation initiation factor IF-2
VIAGCLVQNGEIGRSDNVRLLRDGIVVFNTKISSLKRMKEIVNKVATGIECGITLENFNDLKVGDIIQTYRVIETRQGV